MTERSKYQRPDAGEYLRLAERSERAARILEDDHGRGDAGAMAERRLAAYYRRRYNEVAAVSYVPVATRG